MQKTLIWDLDGTINRCAEYYLAAQEEFAVYKSNLTNIDKDIILDLLRAIDLAATKLPDAFNRHRFPRSFFTTSYAVDALLEVPLQLGQAERAYEIGDSVFEAEYCLYDGAFETLKQYKEAGWSMVLVTKGDYEVQRRKIEKNNLYEIFDPRNVYITLKKSKEFLTNICIDQKVNLDTSWVIGDSLKDDIAPAKAVGLKTVLITPTHNWAYDHSPETEPDVAIDSISDLPSVIELPQWQPA